jgi:flagellar biosynthetic protein FliP
MIGSPVANYRKSMSQTKNILAFRYFASRLLVSRIGAGFLCLLGGSLISSAHAQVPDRGGWSNPGVSNQPGTVVSSQRLSDEIRSQIGLASAAGPISIQPESLQTNAATIESTSEKRSEDFIFSQAERLTAPAGIQSSIKVAILLAMLSLAPAIILMTTCYIRVVVVLSLLRQAFGGQQLPPTQVLTALSIFMTLLIMTPVWSEVKNEAIDPYTRQEDAIRWEEALERGSVPIKNFMISQIEMAGNGESVEIFYKHLPELAANPPSELADVPLKVLLPAFMISELKVAFLLGFQVYLPFLVLDLVVSSVTVSMGMLMLPPNMVSFPLKLILFVMVDGWNLVVGMLLQSFGPFT